MGIFKKAQIGTEQPSLYYDQWAEGNDVKDLDDKPKPLYHGTLSQFNEFRPGGDHNSFYGGNVFYTSTNPVDVEKNYATLQGTDYQSRRTIQAEKIMDDMEDEDWVKLGINPEDWQAQEKYAFELAEKQLRVVSPRTLKLHGKMKNPVNVKPSSPTYYESKFYDEDENEIEDNVYYTIVQAFTDTCYAFNIDPGEAVGEVFSDLDTSYFNAYQFDKTMRTAPSILYAEDHEGNLVMGDFIKTVFQNMGHDGIIMDAYHQFHFMPGVDEDTEHHIFFQPTQLKSWTGNSGYYDYQNPVLTASRRIFLPPR